MNGNILFGAICLISFIKISHASKKKIYMYTGFWSDWMEWSKCESYGKDGWGTRSRRRICSNNLNQEEYQKVVVKDGCYGEATEEDICYVGKCKNVGRIHGEWSVWFQWSDCEKGFLRRIRRCTKPAPKYGGLKCEGKDSERTSCARLHIVFTTLQIRDKYKYRLFRINFSGGSGGSNYMYYITLSFPGMISKNRNFSTVNKEQLKKRIKEMDIFANLNEIPRLLQISIKVGDRICVQTLLQTWKTLNNEKCKMPKSDLSDDNFFISNTAIFPIYVGIMDSRYMNNIRTTV